MNGSIEDLENGYNIWVDIPDHDIDKINDLAHKFNLNTDAVDTCCNKSKKPEIRQFDNHTFTVMLEMKNKDPETLLVEAIYLFLGKNWLITVHSSEVNLMQIAIPEVERSILDYWASDKTFLASVEAREAGVDGSNEYVFYDGPPFANGLPHYGHLLTGYVKDVVPRYQTMRGRRVERRFGWDCHGLPAETETEKQLGISTKAEILELGVDRFNAACRDSVLKFTQDWERYVTRQARWVDFQNDYKTLDLSYMESVLWAFKTLYDKGLIYEGFRVLAYCWRCETPLSNTETRMDDVYRDRTDPASTVWFELETGERVLAWTTMPWTLVPNAALVVGPDIDYAVFEKDGHRYVLAEARLGAYEKELAGATRVNTVKGSELVGRRYKPHVRVSGRPMADAPSGIHRAWWRLRFHRGRYGSRAGGAFAR